MDNKKYLCQQKQKEWRLPIFCINKVELGHKIRYCSGWRMDAAIGVAMVYSLKMYT